MKENASIIMKLSDERSSNETFAERTTYTRRNYSTPGNGGDSKTKTIDEMMILLTGLNSLILSECVLSDVVS